jgi:EmrB/QacA subfamily drug resistance transporter
MDPVPAKSPPPAGYKTIVLVSASLAVIFLTMMSSSLNVALPTIGHEFGSDAVTLGWMVTAFILTSAVFSLPSGRIADILGLKKIFLYGMILYTLISLVAFFSSSSVMVIVCRAVQGTAAAMVAVNSIALVTAVYPPEERGKVLGINIACVYAGSALGPFIGGILTEHLGWRSIFAINIPVGLAVILLLLWKVKGEWRAGRGEKFDYPGSIIYGLALIILMYGFSRLPEVFGGVFVFIGIIGIVAFLLWESRTKSPVLDINIFRHNRVFIFSNLAALISYTAIFAVSFLLSLYLQYIKGYSAGLAGWILIAQPVIQTLFSPFSGKLSDKIEPRLVASAGMALIFSGLLAFSLISRDTSTVVIVVILMVLGLGFALFSSPNSNAVMSSIAPKYLGIASAVMSTMRSVGQTFSLGITMIVMAVIIGPVAITPEYYPAFMICFRIAFGIFAGLCLLGIFTSFSRGKMHLQG